MLSFGGYSQTSFCFPCPAHPQLTSISSPPFVFVSLLTNCLVQGNSTESCEITGTATAGRGCKERQSKPCAVQSRVRGGRMSFARVKAAEEGP